MELDDDGYPTEETLEAIRTYTGLAMDFFAQLKPIWNLADWGWHEENGFKSGLRKRRVRRFRISTGGWSGNEDLIGAMRDNYFLWHLAWVQERVGGHYIFEVRTGDKVFSRVARTTSAQSPKPAQSQ